MAAASVKLIVLMDRSNGIIKGLGIKQKNTDISSVLKRKNNLTVLLFVVALLSTVSKAAIDHSTQSVLLWISAKNANMNLIWQPEQGKTIPLTHGGVNVMPDIDINGNRAWVAWVDKSTAANQIRIGVIAEEGIFEELAGPLTTYASLATPSLYLDSHSQRLWMSWTEFDGVIEDIYLSYVNLDQFPKAFVWSTPMRVTEADDSADTLAHIVGVDENKIDLRWLSQAQGQFKRIVGQFSLEHKETLQLETDDETVTVEEPYLNQIAPYEGTKISPAEIWENLATDVAKFLSPSSPYQSVFESSDFVMGVMHQPDGKSQRIRGKGLL